MTAQTNFGQLYRVARGAAKALTPIAHGVVPQDDLVQEGVLWLYQHPERVEHATLPTGDLYYSQLVAEAARFLAGVVRAERQQAGVFDPEDRYAYSVRMVEIVLPSVFDRNYEPPRPPDGMPRGHGDPAEGGNWQAMALDVKRAVLEVCSDEDRRVLFARSVGGWTWAQFASTFSHSGEFYRQRYMAALRAVCAFLNDGVVLDTTEDAEALADALDPTPVAPALAGDPGEDSWHTIGKDPYREAEW